MFFLKFEFFGDLFFRAFNCDATQVRIHNELRWKIVEKGFCSDLLDWLFLVLSLRFWFLGFRFGWWLWISNDNCWNKGRWLRLGLEYWRPLSWWMCRKTPNCTRIRIRLLQRLLGYYCGWRWWQIWTLSRFCRTYFPRPPIIRCPLKWLHYIRLRKMREVRRTRMQRILWRMKIRVIRSGRRRRVTRDQSRGRPSKVSWRWSGKFRILFYCSSFWL